MIRPLVIVTVFMAGIGGTLWGAGQALSRASERTVTYQYISDALDALSERPNHVEWMPPVIDLIRPFTPGDEGTIGQAMTEAWYSLTLAQSTGETAILRDGFSGMAQERAIRSVEDASHGGQMVVLAQEARPRFFHLDGSVFQADVSQLSVRYMIEGDALSYYQFAKDQAATTLMNETNGWRVYAHERVDSTPLGGFDLEWTGPRMAGINYYPANTPWRLFWPSFDEFVIADDFERIVALGGNAVRVFLTSDMFEDPKNRQDGLDRLNTLLRLAERAGLHLVPTLFDLKYSFDPAGWGEDYEFLKAVLPVLAASHSVVLLDLKNEPDLDFEAHGRGRILAWLTTMATLVRIEAPKLPLTIGWASSDAAMELEEIVDVVTYHDYADVGTSAERLAEVQAQTKKPVMITEIGYSSYEVALSLPGSLEKQEQALNERLTALEQSDGVFIWTLYDFNNVDASAVGTSPLVQKQQSNFGLFTKDGSEKPSAAVVQSAFEKLLAR